MRWLFLRQWLRRELQRLSLCRRHRPKEIKTEGERANTSPFSFCMMNATAQLDGGNCYLCFFLRFVEIVTRTMEDKTSKHRRLMEMIIAYLATV